MTPPRILVAGIGNIFLGDDAFGTEVAQRLLRLTWPENVRVADYGIRGLDLTYALIDGWDAAILIDAVPRGGEPGTLYVIQPEDIPGENCLPEGHSMDPRKVLAMVRAMDCAPSRIRILGCEPSAITEFGELSQPVAAAMDEAVNLTIYLVEQLTKEIENESLKGTDDRSGGCSDSRHVAGYQTLHTHQHDVSGPAVSGKCA